MRAEELLSLAAVNGVDFNRAARHAASSKDARISRAAKDVIQKRFGTNRRAPVLVPPPDSQAKGKESASILRPDWTIAEIGQASAGMLDLHFRAALFAYAGDYSGYWPLHRALWDEGVKLREDRAWSPVVLDVHGLERTYLAHLAKMVLDEDHSPNLFTVCPQLYQLYLQVDEKTWVKTLGQRFEALKLVWLGWIWEAARIIQPRLAEHEFETETC